MSKLSIIYANLIVFYETNFQTNVRCLVRAVFYSDMKDCDEDDEIQLPESLQGDNLYHVSPRQKMLIATNLIFLQSKLDVKVQQFTMCHIYDQNDISKRNNFTGDFDTVLAATIQSILTPPEIDAQLSANIIELSKHLTDCILKHVKMKREELGSSSSASEEEENHSEPIIAQLLRQIGHRYQRDDNKISPSQSINNEKN